MPTITAIDLLSSIFEQIAADGRYISRKEADIASEQGSHTKSTGQSVYAKIKVGHYPAAATSMRGKADAFLTSWKPPAKPNWVEPMGFTRAVTLFVSWSDSIKKGNDPVILDFGASLPDALLMFTLSGKAYFKATRNNYTTVNVTSNSTITTPNTQPSANVTTNVQQVTNPCSEIDIFGDTITITEMNYPTLRYFVKIIDTLTYSDEDTISYFVQNKAGEIAKFKLSNKHALVVNGLLDPGDCIVLMARRVIDPLSKAVTLKKIKFLENKTQGRSLENVKPTWDDGDLWVAPPKVNWTR